MAKRGAQPGNKLALKHGKYTRERRALLADIRAHIRKTRALLCGNADAMVDSTQRGSALSHRMEVKRDMIAPRDQITC